MTASYEPGWRTTGTVRRFHFVCSIKGVAQRVPPRPKAPTSQMRCSVDKRKEREARRERPRPSRCRNRPERPIRQPLEKSVSHRPRFPRRREARPHAPPKCPGTRAQSSNARDDKRQLSTHLSPVQPVPVERQSRRNHTILLANRLQSTRPQPRLSSVCLIVF